MRVVVTAGNTLVPIDRVRCITNVFSGRTGAAIALHAHQRGHAVTLLTSHPEALAETPAPGRWTLQTYRTFDDLQRLMQAAVHAAPDVFIHCAAVSDYETAGVYAPGSGTRFDPDGGYWKNESGKAPSLSDRSAGKIKSDEPEIWLRLVRTPKLIDLVRNQWGFQGILVKFKLEVGLEDRELLEIAERSRRQSSADLMVANTLEGAQVWAYLGPVKGEYQRVNRAQLAERLMDAVEARTRERGHG